VFARSNGKIVNRLGAGSTKRLGNAVERNRQKRLVREAYRLLKHDLPLGYDIVIVPRVPWHDPTREELMNDLRSALWKAVSKEDTR